VIAALWSATECNTRQQRVAEGRAQRGMHTPCLQRAWPQVAEQKCVRKRSGTGNATPQTDLNVRVALELSLALFEPVHVA
jgi:hypothetical protein